MSQGCQEYVVRCADCVVRRLRTHLPLLSRLLTPFLPVPAFILPTTHMPAAVLVRVWCVMQGQRVPDHPAT